MYSSIGTVTWCLVDLEALWYCSQPKQSPSPHSEHQMSDTFEMWQVKHTPQSGIGLDIVWKGKINHIIFLKSSKTIIEQNLHMQIYFEMQT